MSSTGTRRAYDQLTSEYSGKFPKEMAKYALKHVKVNYKHEALGSAKSYVEALNISTATAVRPAHE